MRQREKIVNFLLCGMKQNLACEGVEIRVRPPYACRSASCYGVDAPGGRKRTRTPRHVQSTRNDGMNEKTSKASATAICFLSKCTAKRAD